MVSTRVQSKEKLDTDSVSTRSTSLAYNKTGYDGRMGSLLADARGPYYFSLVSGLLSRLDPNRVGVGR
jgi:hypothetical protein